MGHKPGEDDGFDDDMRTIVTPWPAPAPLQPTQSPPPPTDDVPLGQHFMPAQQRSSHRYQAPEPPPEPVHEPEPPRQRVPVRSPPRDARLSALKSLSLDKTGGEFTATRTRTAWLPWTLLVLVVAGFVTYQFVLPRFAKPASTGGTNGSATNTLTVTASGGGGALHAAGYIAARTPIVVGSVAPGRVKAMLVSEGTVVKKNQVIAQLDDGAARAEMSLAGARLRDAERLLKRMQMLRKAEAATAEELDRTVGQVEIARAALAPISQRIEDAKIRSPIDGTILEELVHQGAIIVGNAGVFKIADMKQLSAEIDVNEADLAQVRVNQKVEIISEAFAGRTFAGAVHDVSTQVDRSKGTVQVKVYVEVDDNTLRPGMSVKATFEAGGEKPRILIPKTAVDSGGNVSLVGTDGVVSKRHVTVQDAGPSQVEVVEGLAAGDRIVVEPATPH